MSDPTEIIIENGESVPTKLPIPTERQQKRTRRKLIPKLLRVAGRIPFADDLAAAYYCAIDAETPMKAKLVLFAALGYFVLPVDMIPRLWNGQYRGQEQTWVAMRFNGKDSDIILDADDHPEFSQWQWIDLDETLGLIVPFKRETYQQVIKAFQNV